MFYISLPFFYQNYKFNNFFKHYVSRNKEKLVDNFSIEYFYGAFPWSYWSGGINPHSGKAVLLPEIEYIINTSAASIRLDQSNCFLTEKDYLDIHENVILNQLFNTGGVCEISDLNLMNYITQLNDNIKFIISNHSEIIQPFTDEIINIFINQDNIELISMNNILDSNQKNKIELVIGNCKCPKEKLCECIYQEQLNTYTFSGRSVLYKCPFHQNIKNYYDEIYPLYKQGYTHFKINPQSNYLDLNAFNQKIILSFIKPEYIGECLIEYDRNR